jgi:hypothetical protein
MKYVVILAALALLTGCATGPSYKEAKRTLPKLEEGKARLIIYRTKESKLYIAKSAPIALNNAEIGKVGYGGFSFKDVSPGSYILKTTAWDWPGSCEISFTIQDADKSYFFEVKPREESYAAFKDGSIIILPEITGLIAAANESKGKACGGLFAIIPTEAKNAAAQLER